MPIFSKKNPFCSADEILPTFKEGMKLVKENPSTHTFIIKNREYDGTRDEIEFFNSDGYYKVRVAPSYDSERLHLWENPNYYNRDSYSLATSYRIRDFDKVNFEDVIKRKTPELKMEIYNSSTKKRIKLCPGKKSKFGNTQTTEIKYLKKFS